MDSFTGRLIFVRTRNPFRKPDNLPDYVAIPLQHAYLEELLSVLHEHTLTEYALVGFEGQIEQKISLN
jgi:hypothetical protein